MPSNAIITFSFAGLPAGYCYTSPERFALDIVAAMQGYLPGSYSTIVRSESEPVATDRDKVWVQVNADGAFTGKSFTYAYGKWVMLNPRRDPAERVWFEGSESDAWSYDGGDGMDPTSNPPTATTGAMWVVDHNYDFRFPLGAGTSPNPTTVSVGDTGGEEEVTLGPTQVPDHGHIWTKFTSTDDEGSGSAADDFTLGPDQYNTGGPFPVGDSRNPIGVTTGGGLAHPNMPPWRAGFWLKPSQRSYYTS